MTLKDRLMAKVEMIPESGCWIFTGCWSRLGYGMIGHEGKLKSAHRVAWTIHKGDIPDGMHVLHRCDTRSCVNPEHLFLGTHQDNMKDRDIKGRSCKPVLHGERHTNNKLTNEAVFHIRRREMSARAYSELYGVKPHTVNDVLARRRWKHL